MELSLPDVQTALIGLPSRADRDKQERLLETFVDAQPLFTLLQSTNNQAIFGRRGTGKTHALKVLADWAASNRDAALFLDLRTIGSNGSIYTDQELQFTERATRLLLDVGRTIHDELLAFATSDTARIRDGARLADAFQRLEGALSTVRVAGTSEVSTTSADTSVDSNKSSASFLFGANPAPSLGAERERRSTTETSVSTRESGTRRYYIQFPTIHDSIRDVLSNLHVERMWLLLDEWSEIPSELQPYLADLLRRSILPISEVTVKIAAIEHRTNFIIHQDGGSYIGFEAGADVAADLNLDDFMVFDNDPERARTFFANLFYKHYITTPNASHVETPDQLITFLFTQNRAFDELVRAAEGVPRDAIYLISKIAQRAFGKRIAMEDVQQGARDWYQQDKYAVVRQDEKLSRLLEKLIEEVIGNRRSRAFLFRSGLRYPYLDRLFDARLLHILKRGRSSPEEPGVRYDVYKLDYGCYVELLRTTTKTPLGLLLTDDNSYVEVPPDDYRSVRRAILRPDNLDL